MNESDHLLYSHSLQKYVGGIEKGGGARRTVALKKFRIGEGMDVEVAVNWDKRQTSQTWNSKIDITFKTRELEAENKYQRAELGKATDPARASEYSRTGINYFTVNPKVNAEVGKNGMVFR